MAKFEGYIYIGTGNTCPQCLETTSLYWNKETNDVIEHCKICKRKWKPDERKPLDVYCSCGCAHIIFSEIIYGTWHIVKDKCIHGNTVTHLVLTRKSVL